MSLPHKDRRFVTPSEAVREVNAWTQNEILSREDVVPAEKLLVVRAHMRPGFCHPFHKHPHREEIIYVLEGTAEQWVENEYRLLGPGDMAHIPPGVVHGTYNPHATTLTFLAILSPAKLSKAHAAVEDPQDVSNEEPWASLRAHYELAECRFSLDEMTGATKPAKIL